MMLIASRQRQTEQVISERMAFLLIREGERAKAIPDSALWGYLLEQAGLHKNALSVLIFMDETPLCTGLSTGAMEFVRLDDSAMQKRG
jgi:hypothetical protein